MQALRADIDLAARSHAKVLVTGETGVGKELVARLIHQRSARQTEPFITINCAGVPDTLLESEFFGHARGSFTGAFRDSPGLLRQADRGTIFLDEVGEMSARLQALLLRFLETGEIQAVGGHRHRETVDVRLIAATNRDLPGAVAAREFRADLYYRLNVLHLEIPPLRARGSDVQTLLEHYLTLFAAQHGVVPPTVSQAALDRLIAYHWPGNVRELRNVVERVVVRAGLTIEPSHLPAEIVAPPLEHACERSESVGSHQARVHRMLDRMVIEHESFWTTAYPVFMARDMTRDDLRYIIRAGLEQTQGSYRVLLGLFNMAADDYKRFLGFLKQHDCHLPFQGFRMLRARPAAEADRPSIAEIA